ncbi:MAG: polysaccharide export protein [Hyphomicrobiales bacterium]|nr:polysaccharide export protein [Hyphomicrobiales bacterium]
MRRSLAVFCLLLASPLAGCATRATAPAELFATAAEAPYQVDAGDRLRIIVFGQDSLSNSYTVDASGHISMPLIGQVAVRGQTPAQIQRNVESRLRAGFLRDPKVSCEVEAYRPFFILGEVNAAGQYPYVNGMTVQTAVAIAGGYTPRAQQSSATLTRTLDGQPYVGEVSVGQPVRPGDTIKIRERFF